MTKKKRYRTIDPTKAREAAGGGLGWYERIPVQGKKTCSCGEGAKSEPCPECAKKREATP